jgi:hypothetical protein
MAGGKFLRRPAPPAHRLFAGRKKDLPAAIARQSGIFTQPRLFGRRAHRRMRRRV